MFLGIYEIHAACYACTYTRTIYEINDLYSKGKNKYKKNHVYLNISQKSTKKYIPLNNFIISVSYRCKSIKREQFVLNEPRQPTVKI